MNTKIFIAFVCMFLTVSCGCSQPKALGSSPKTFGRDDFCSAGFERVPVHYETLAESLARSLAEPEATGNRVGGLGHEEWNGRTLLELGRLRKITVPHVGAGADRASLEVSTLQIQKTLTEYVLVNFERFRSSTHIPLGTGVTLEYEDGVIGWVNMYAGIPYYVDLRKDGRYGLERVAEQGVAPDGTGRGR